MHDMQMPGGHPNRISFHPKAVLPVPSYRFQGYVVYNEEMIKGNEQYLKATNSWEGQTKCKNKVGQ